MLGSGRLGGSLDWKLLVRVNLGNRVSSIAYDTLSCYVV
jgi:hypothetical protein